MTSAISFRKLLKYDIRQRSWLILLISAVSLFLYPLYFLMEQQDLRARFLGASMNNAATAEYVASQKLQAVSAVFGSDNVMSFLALVVAAVLCAVTGYAWMHSREKEDLFASLAIRRERYFFVPYAGGFIITVVPYLVFTWLGLLVIGGMTGSLTPAAVKVLLLANWKLILVFFAMYSVCVLAMVLTGRIITGVLMIIFLFGYGPACFYLLRGYMLQYFRTYVAMDSVMSSFGWNLSVFSAGAKLLTAHSGIGMHVLIAAFGIVSLVLSLVLVRVRPSESAENALIFPWMRPVLKVIVTVPAALLGGLIFGTFPPEHQTAWMIFGLVFTALFVNCVMEFIYSTDIRNFWRHRISLAAALVLTAVIAAVFVKDLFGYDRWLPKQADVDKMSIWINDAYSSQASTYTLLGSRQEQMLSLQANADFQPVYQVVENKMNGVYGEPDGDQDLSENAPVITYGGTDGNGNAWGNYTVRYQLKNGDVRYRSYRLPAKEARAALYAQLQDPSYREVCYPVNTINTAVPYEIQVIDWKDLKGPYQKAKLGKEKTAELIRTLQRETNACAPETLDQAEPVGVMMLTKEELLQEEMVPYGYNPYAAVDTLTHQLDDSEIDNYVDMVYIYPEYKDTIRMLEEGGVVFRQQQQDISEFLSVEVNWNLTEDEYYPAAGADGYGGAEMITWRDYVVSDPEDMKLLFDCTARRRETEDNDAHWYTMSVSWQEGGAVESNGFCFRITDPELFEDVMSRAKDRTGDR